MLGKQYLKYVSSNILGMMGLSFYILADTYFVAARLGADGLAALNIAIPGYSLVNATGLMVAMGGAVRYTIAQSQGQKKQAHEIFTKTMLTGWFFSAIYLLMGIFLATPLAALLGAEGHILPMTADYLRCKRTGKSCIWYRLRLGYGKGTAERNGINRWQICSGACTGTDT